MNLPSYPQLNRHSRHLFCHHECHLAQLPLFDKNSKTIPAARAIYSSLSERLDDRVAHVHQTRHRMLHHLPYLPYNHGILVYTLTTLLREY
ncbi:hypothetical protein KSS87_017986, partial [Heliosperma pusillum]